ncbi:hypothetical protein L345_03248, partial [Ophiophagus hannah]
MSTKVVEEKKQTSKKEGRLMERKGLFLCKGKYRNGRASLPFPLSVFKLGNLVCLGSNAEFFNLGNLKSCGHQLAELPSQHGEFWELSSTPLEVAKLEEHCSKASLAFFNICVCIYSCSIAFFVWLAFCPMSPLFLFGSSDICKVWSKKSRWRPSFNHAAAYSILTFFKPDLADTLFASQREQASLRTTNHSTLLRLEHLQGGSGWRQLAKGVDNSRDWVPTPTMASTSVGADVNKGEINVPSACPLENWSRGLWHTRIISSSFNPMNGRLAPGLPGVSCHFFSKKNPPLAACLSL